MLGLQSANGGWGSFDADNTHDYLNNIPFADHGALLDPPTADLTARCLCMLAQQGYPRNDPAVSAALEFLRREQEPDGSWFGRWGTNYVYGTWSVLCALNAVGEDPQAPYVRKAVAWLEARQQADGGWGESCASYWEGARTSGAEPALPDRLGAARPDGGGRGRERRGRARDRLSRAGAARGRRWDEELYNAVGFPRVFYLRYHGYSAVLPALGAGALPQPDAPERPPRRLGHVRRRGQRSAAGTSSGRTRRRRGHTRCSSVALARAG